MKNIKIILIIAGVLAVILCLRSCETTWNPIKNILGLKSDTVHVTKWRDTTIYIPTIRIDSVRAVVKYYYPIYKDSILYKTDSTIIAQRDSLTALLAKSSVKINASCDTTRPAQGDSIPWVKAHIEYDEVYRYFHNIIIDVKPVHALIPEQTNIISKQQRFVFGIGAGFGFNSDIQLSAWRVGWSIGVQGSYYLGGF